MPAAELPPGPRGSRLAGSLTDFSHYRLEFFLQLARDYGPLASFRLGPRRIFLASDPELIEKVLVTDARYYIKHFGARGYKSVLGNGLVTSEGDFWLRQRRLSQPSFLKQRIQSYLPLMVEMTERMLERWTSGSEIDIQAEFSSLTSVIALKTLFDLDDASDRAAFAQNLRIAFDVMSSRIRRLIKFPLWVPTPDNVRLNRAVKHLYGVVDKFIAAGRARRVPGSDLLSRLIAARDDDGSQMSDKQLREEMMTLYLAGHETTALTLSWSWYLISQHPHVEERLVAEWDTVLAGRFPTAEDLMRLPYTDAVITEAMRIYPPVYLLGREATCDLELGGYRVKKGYTVFMSQWVNHRDSRYFPEPERFLPERWIDGLAERIPKFTYYPFGGGPRICIGNLFALMEAALILAGVGQRYRFQVQPGTRIEMNPQITLMPKYGIPVRLIKREPASPAVSVPPQVQPKV